MTSGQDEARAREIVDALIEDIRDRKTIKWFFPRPDEGEGATIGGLLPVAQEAQQQIRDAWTAVLLPALSEARDQGARDRDAQIIETCRQKGNGDVPFITELTAKLPLPSAAPDIFAESAKNTQALAPLRGAVVTAAMAEHSAWLAYNDAMDAGKPDVVLGDAYSEAAGKRLEACAALSSAQGPTTEGHDV